MIWVRAFGFAVGLLWLSCSAQSPAEWPKRAEIDQFLVGEFKKLGAPGMAVAIVRNGKVAYAQGFGYADLAAKTPVQPNTVFRLGSVTKQFTATMIMQLVQEGTLTLNTKLGDVLPDSPKAWQAVTIRQLLSHTAGIPSYTAAPDFLDFVKKDVTVDHINDRVKDKPLDFTPGSAWRYSNSGYILLGQIIERVTGKSYADNLASRILTPLEMRETYFVRETARVKNRANGYTDKGGEAVPASPINMVWPFAAGAMESTVLDMAKWDAALYTNKVLPQSALEEMWTPIKLSTGGVQNYGFGWIPVSINGIPTVSHGGGINGFASDIFRVPSLGTTVIVLANSDGANPESVARHLLGFLDPRLQPPTISAVEDKDPATTAFIRRALDGILAGKADASTFSPEMLKVLTLPALESFQQLGAIQKMELVKSADDGGVKRRVYRVTFANATLTGTFVIDRSGLIAGAELH